MRLVWYVYAIGLVCVCDWFGMCMRLIWYMLSDGIRVLGDFLMCTGDGYVCTGDGYVDDQVDLDILFISAAHRKIFIEIRYGLDNEKIYTSSICHTCINLGINGPICMWFCLCVYY